MGFSYYAHLIGVFVALTVVVVVLLPPLLLFVSLLSPHLLVAVVCLAVYKCALN